MTKESEALARSGRTVAIVQARMSSQRLPGKVLADLGGRPALGLLLARLSRASELNDVVVATSDHHSDDPIVDFCNGRGQTVYRGPLDNVLERYRQAATAAGADLVVRVTGDCPLVDPLLVDDLVRFFRARGLHYAGLEGEFPHGLDCEVFSASALAMASAKANTAYDREHVTPYMKRHPNEFPTGVFAPILGLEDERWTLDFTEDLILLRQLAGLLGEDLESASYREIAAALRANPEVRAVNRHRCVSRS